jgi:hypothetical protein
LKEEIALSEKQAEVDTWEEDQQFEESHKTLAHIHMVVEKDEVVLV